MIKNFEKGLNKQELLKKYKNKTIIVENVYEDKEKQEKMEYLIKIFKGFEKSKTNLNFIKKNLELFDYIIKS